MRLYHRRVMRIENMQTTGPWLTSGVFQTFTQGAHSYCAFDGAINFATIRNLTLYP